MFKKNLYKLFSVCLILFLGPANAEGLNLGINFEFVEPASSGFAENELDGGFGFHIGYEFKKRPKWKNWNLGVQYEQMDGWNKPEKTYYTGEFMYSSKSILATARPTDWPIIFKAGLVNANYKVLLQTGTQNFNVVNDTGYALGFALVGGGEQYRFELLDFKHTKIGNKSFNSLGLSFSIILPAFSDLK